MLANIVERLAILHAGRAVTAEDVREVVPVTADAAAWADDLRGLADDYFFSLNRYLFLARR